MKRLKKILRILLLVTVISAALILTAGCTSLNGKATKLLQSTDAPIYTFVPTQTDAATALPDSTPTAAPTKAPTAVPTAAPTKVPEPEINTPYVGNANSKVFHSAGCSSVWDMKKSNRVPLSSREEAIEKGYKPCQRCNP